MRPTPFCEYSFEGLRSSVFIVAHPEDAIRLESSTPSFLLADDNTARLLPLGDRPRLILRPGEPSKSWNVLGSVLDAAATAGLGREGILIGFGGGVVCDLAAFASGLYMRGIRLILAPTSLVAMADAAIGGKAAVDHGGIRNAIGLFHAATEIRIHIPFLATLPEREYRAGLAELAKTGLVAAPKVANLLRERRADFENRDLGLLDEAVRRCVLAKAALCERDPRDHGDRLRLNFGHTFAHALEASHPEILHGEAVAWGMVRALELGVALGVTEPAFAQDARELLESYGFTLAFPGLDAAVLLRSMRSDKKAAEGIRIVLARGECSVAVEKVEESRIIAALEGGIA